MAKNNTNKKKGISGGQMAGMAAGAAAVGAGAYYLLGPKGKAHQKKAKILLGKIKREVASEVKKAKQVSTPIYHKAVDAIAENYSEQYRMHEKDIKSLAKKLKGEWKEANQKVKKTARTLKKKATKKVSI